MSTVQCNLVQPTMLSFGSRVGLTVVSLLARHMGLSQTLSEAGPTTLHMRISTLQRNFQMVNIVATPTPRGVWVLVMSGKRGLLPFVNLFLLG